MLEFNEEIEEVMEVTEVAERRDWGLRNPDSGYSIPQYPISQLLLNGRTASLKQEGSLVEEIQTDKLNDVVDVVVVEVPRQLEPASLDGGGAEAD